MKDERKYDLEERLIAFAEMIGIVCNRLDSNKEARTFENQLIRSGTSPALNYAEALVAQSTPDFIHKISICLKELKESEVILKLIYLRRISSDPAFVLKCQHECSELVAIFITSVQTARRNAGIKS